jgi:hypothetical protein
MVNIKYKLDQQTKKTFKELIEEIYLLKQIKKLPQEIISIIYHYMTGIPKFLYNVKYNYLEIHVKNDCYKKYLFWKYLNDSLDPLDKTQLINVIFNSSINKYPAIYNKIWYFSKETSNYYDGINLLKLWTGEISDPNFDKENIKNIDYFIKIRFIGAIYYYLLQIINNYERKKYKFLYFTNKESLVKVFNDLDNSFKLYKSICYICDILVTQVN